MAKANKGDVLSCELCGLVVSVDESCGCAAGEIICCEEPMTRTGSKSSPAKSKAPAKKAPAKKKAPEKKAAPKKKVEKSTKPAKRK